MTTRTDTHVVKYTVRGTSYLDAIDEAVTRLRSGVRLVGVQSARALTMLPRQAEVRRERSLPPLWEVALVVVEEGTASTTGEQTEAFADALGKAFADGRNVLPTASDDEAAVIEEWARDALVRECRHDGQSGPFCGLCGGEVSA